MGALCLSSLGCNHSGEHHQPLTESRCHQDKHKAPSSKTPTSTQPRPLSLQNRGGRSVSFPFLIGDIRQDGMLDYSSPTSGLVRLPRRSISTVTVSPGFMNTCGLRVLPMPGGVPVMITSPASSVTMPEI